MGRDQATISERARALFLAYPGLRVCSSTLASLHWVLIAMKSPTASAPAPTRRLDVETDATRAGLKIRRTSFPPWSSASARLNASNQAPKKISQSPIPLPPVPSTKGNGGGNVVFSKQAPPSSEPARMVSDIVRPEKAAATTEAPRAQAQRNSAPVTKPTLSGQTRIQELQRTRERRQIGIETPASSPSMLDAFSSDQDAEAAEIVGNLGSHTVKATFLGLETRKRPAQQSLVGAVREAKRRRTGHPPPPGDDSPTRDDDWLQTIETSPERSLDIPLNRFSAVKAASAPVTAQRAVVRLDSSSASDLEYEEDDAVDLDEDELTMEVDGTGDRTESEDWKVARRNFRQHSFPKHNIHPLPGRLSNGSSSAAKFSLTRGDLVALETATDGRAYNLYKGEVPSSSEPGPALTRPSTIWKD